MKKSPVKQNNGRLSFVMGSLLRSGVIFSAILVMYGGILFFIQHPAETYNYSAFGGEPSKLKSLTLIFQGALELRGRAVIQTGLLVLIATPILRVLFSLLYFLFEKDWVYVAITMIVLTVLINSLVSL